MEEDEEETNDSAYYYGSVSWFCETGGGNPMPDEKIVKATQEFAQIIKSSDSYKQYVHARVMVQKQAGLFEEVNEFRRKNYQLQNNASGDELLEKTEALNQEYIVMRSNPLVEEFLDAELAFCRMMQEVNILLTNELNFE